MDLTQIVTNPVTFAGSSVLNRDDSTATDAGAVVLLYMEKDAEAPVISWRKITSGLGGFNIRLQVHTCI